MHKLDDDKLAVLTGVNAISIPLCAMDHCVSSREVQGTAYAEEVRLSRT